MDDDKKDGLEALEAEKQGFASDEEVAELLETLDDN